MANDTVGETIAGIFTSKFVGALFALSFGAWAVVLGTVKSDIIAGQQELAQDMAEVKAQVYEHKLFSAAATAEFRAEIADSERRLRLLESRHRNGTKHTTESDEEQ